MAAVGRESEQISMQQFGCMRIGWLRRIQMRGVPCVCRRGRHTDGSQADRCSMLRRKTERVDYGELEVSEKAAKTLRFTALGAFIGT